MEQKEMENEGESILYSERNTKGQGTIFPYGQVVSEREISILKLLRINFASIIISSFSRLNILQYLILSKLSFSIDFKRIELRLRFP